MSRFTGIHKYDDLLAKPLHWTVNIALGVVGGIFYRLKEGFARASDVQIFNFGYTKDEDDFLHGELELIQEIVYDRGMTESRLRRVLESKIRDKLITMLGLADDVDMPF